MNSKCDGVAWKVPLIYDLGFNMPIGKKRVLENRRCMSCGVGMSVRGKVVSGVVTHLESGDWSRYLTVIFRGWA